MKRLAMCGPWRLLQWKNGSSSKWQKSICNSVYMLFIYILLTLLSESGLFFYPWCELSSPLQVICIWGWQIMWHEWKSWCWNSSFPGTVKRGPELWVHFGKFNETIWSHSLDLLCIQIGIVLGTIFAGGTLIANKEMSPGELMSFLVASQTVQRWQTTVPLFFWLIYLLHIGFLCSGLWPVSLSSLDK